IHARRGLRVRRRQGGARQHAVEIAQDRLRLIDAEVAMFEHWHASERMSRQMGLALERTGRHRGDPVRRALFLQRREDRPPERAAGHRVNDELGHDKLLRTWPEMDRTISAYYAHGEEASLRKRRQVQSCGDRRFRGLSETREWPATPSS